MEPSLIQEPRLAKSPVETYRFREPSKIGYDTAWTLGFFFSSLLPHFVDLAKVEGAASLEVAFNAFDALEAVVHLKVEKGFELG